MLFSGVPGPNWHVSGLYEGVSCLNVHILGPNGGIPGLNWHVSRLDGINVHTSGLDEGVSGLNGLNSGLG